MTTPQLPADVNTYRVYVDGPSGRKVYCVDAKSAADAKADINNAIVGQRGYAIVMVSAL